MVLDLKVRQASSLSLNGIRQAGSLSYHTSSGDSRVNILIVDDDVMVQQACQAMLKQLGHSSIGVQNAVDAVKRLTETPLRFELVIIDNGLPELSGMELFNVLREWNVSIPVILISTNRPHPEIEELMEGFSNIQFLSKPFSMEALQTAIKSSQA